MALRCQLHRTRLFKNLTRGPVYFGSSPCPSSTVCTTLPYSSKDPPPGERVATKRDALDLTFNNPEAAFKSKNSWELIRGYIVFTFCSFEYVVKNNMRIMDIARIVLGGNGFAMVMGWTFYGHFVGGEDREKVVPLIKHLKSFGVGSILDYSVEENISQEHAESLEKQGSSSEIQEISEALLIGGDTPQYNFNKQFADRRKDVNSARTYFYLNEATCERNTENFLETIQAAGTSGITAVKLTALGRPQLLLQLSEVITRARKYASDIIGGKGNVIGRKLTIEELTKRLEQSGIKNAQDFLKNVVTDEEGVIHLFPWSGILNEQFKISETFRVPSLTHGKMVRLTSQLSPREEEMFRNMIRRINILVKSAKENNVSLMIDAEQSYFQPAISRITLELMRKYNGERGVVCNTYQCYLRDVMEELTTDLEQAKRQNFHFGAKLVRGAYMNQERERAKILGYTDPINATYEDTSETYHTAAVECLRRIKEDKEKGAPPKMMIMIASHNEDTIRFTVDKMEEMGIGAEDRTVCFGQLFGMCDYITFPLGQAGYSAYKYVPYGPVTEVLPYLSRRIQENNVIKNKIKKEKSMILRELKRRVLKGQLFYAPRGEYDAA